MLVSIITVCFNSSRTILETIASVNSQTYNEIEHVFIDCISRDNTLELIKANSSRKPIIISEKDNGIYDAMNKGIKHSNGEIVFILNSDDILYSKDVVEQVVSEFTEHPNVKLAYGPIYISKENNIRSYTRNWKVTPYHFKNGFRKGWHPPHPGFIVRKEVYNKSGGFNLQLPIAADFELMFRLIEVEKLDCHLLAFPIAVLREGGASNSLKGIINGMRDVRKAFFIHGIKIPFSYFIYRYYSKLKQKLSFNERLN